MNFHRKRPLTNLYARLCSNGQLEQDSVRSIELHPLRMRIEKERNMCPRAFKHFIAHLPRWEGNSSACMADYENFCRRKQYILKGSVAKCPETLNIRVINPRRYAESIKGKADQIGAGDQVPAVRNDSDFDSYTQIFNWFNRQSEAIKRDVFDGLSIGHQGAVFSASLSKDLEPKLLQLAKSSQSAETMRNALGLEVEETCLLMIVFRNVSPEHIPTIADAGKNVFFKHYSGQDFGSTLNIRTWVQWKDGDELTDSGWPEVVHSPQPMTGRCRYLLLLDGVAGPLPGGARERAIREHCGGPL